MRRKEALNIPGVRERLEEWRRLQRVAQGNVGHYDRDLCLNELGRDLRIKFFGSADVSITRFILSSPRGTIPVEVTMYQDAIKSQWYDLSLEQRDEITSGHAQRKLNEMYERNR